METVSPQDINEHYSFRHTIREDLYPSQPFANYGYWTRQDMSIEQAGEAMAALVAVNAGLNPADKVLDLGCGYGACAVVYGKRFQPASVIGLDITEVRIQEGREYVKKHGLSSSIDLRLGDATKTGFPDASFDKVVAVECAFHFPTRLDFLREAFRVLKPGGTLALTDLIPAPGRTKDFCDYQVNDKAGAVVLQMYNMINAYEADVYARHLREIGYVGIRIESIIDWTLPHFIPALHRHADRTRAQQNAPNIHRHATRLNGLVEAGEDYVIVVARKPA